MLTLNAADEPERGFVADFSVVWPVNAAATNPLPYLYEVRDDTVPLTLNLSPFTSSVASGG